MELENSFLYFYSTMPQVLGALVALLGVFILFKLQSLNNSIVSFGEQISKKIINETFLSAINNRELRLLKEHLKEGILRQDVETIVSQVSGINRVLNEINKKTNFTDDNSPEIMAEKNGLIKTFQILENIQWSCLEFKDNLIIDTKHLLKHSTIVIILSIIGMLISHILLSTNNTLFLLIISAIIFVWFSYCLIKLVQLIIISLSHDYNDEKMFTKKGLLSIIKSIFKKRKHIKYKRQWKT